MEGGEKSRNKNQGDEEWKEEGRGAPEGLWLRVSVVVIQLPMLEDSHSGVLAT